MIVEKLMLEIEELMTRQPKTCCYDLKNDIDPEIIKQNLEFIANAREHICKLAEKYTTDKHSQSLQRIIAAKKTKMWEVLCDSKARKLKGFGEFPQRLIKEYDEDIDELMSIASKLEY
jgi:hypothetical protein